MNETIIGDCRETMRALIDQGVCVQMCVTSPPYWGLRDFGAVGQIGLESSIEEYVDKIVEVFGLVRDLLNDDGTLWLNMGDAYCHGTEADRLPTTAEGPRVPSGWSNRSSPQRIRPVSGLKSKDLVMMPARVALALQADGWWLRQDIIWHKPNPMPESVTDRCTKAHEYLFLLSKSERYYFDVGAISEPASLETHPRGPGNQKHKCVDNLDGSRSFRTASGLLKHSRKLAANGSGTKTNGSFDGAMASMPERRNRRSVWTVASEPYSEAHFATFPSALIEPCIVAGSRVGDVVFDPFIGSGTTGQVAQDLGRQWLGCELNPEYVKLERKRTAQQAMVLPVSAD